MAKEVTYELVAKYFTGNCTEAEKHEVESWRDTNADNLTAFNQYRAIWENASKPANIFSPDVEGALGKVNRKLYVKAVPEKRNKIVPFITYASRVAAAILVGVGIWLAFNLIRHKQDTSELMTAVSNGEKTEITLADGTHIWLNKNTRVRYPKVFEGKERKIFIEGEAYFDVAKNAEKPFVIETEKSVVTVVGTEFNLRARKNEIITEVVVTEGKVAFTAKKQKTLSPVYLLPGDKGILRNEKQEIEVVKNQNANFLAWKTGKLVFDNTPLIVMASDLSDYFGKTIEIGDTSKYQIPVTSVFENKSLQDILAIIEISTGIKADTTGQKVVLK